MADNERIPFLRDKTGLLTSSPGVYIMKDKNNNIIYIGKAKNLKNRVSSYFRKIPDHTPKVAKMVSKVYDYDFIVTNSEYEALLLECSLIKQHKPQYNILLKDDKGYNYIRVSDGDFPSITTEKNKLKPGEYLGVYTSSFVASQTVDEVNRVFKLPDCGRNFHIKSKPCLNYHINRCMGLCRGEITSVEYKNIISQAVDYIKNGSIESIKRLEKEMNQAAENLEFERAAMLRDRIAAINKSVSGQQILGNTLESTDFIAIVRNESKMCASVLVYRGGRLFDKASFIIGECDEFERSVEDFIIQFYESHDIPKEIITEYLPENTDIIEKLLKEKSGHAVHISSRQKGEGYKYLMLSKKNASEYLSVKVGRTAHELIALEQLSKLLGLPKIPKYIEAYDISNLSSAAMVAGMVVFENGRPLKKAYKHFSIKNVYIQNDYACMREVLERRFKRYLDENTEDEGFSAMPDLIFVDGGQGQVNAVLPVLNELGIDVKVYGIVKDGKHRTRAIASDGGEISVSSAKEAFNLLTNIQDEMHRFAISYQRKRHSKNTFELQMTKVKGIGVKKAQKIIRHFKTIENLKKASPQELSVIAGVNIETANELYELIQVEMQV